MPKSKFVPEAQQIILDSIKMGAPDGAAAQRAGINRKTLRQWVLQGEEGDEKFVPFSQAYTRAHGDRVTALVKIVYNDAASGGLESAKWLLTRYAPETFSEKHQHELSGPDGTALLQQRQGLTNLEALMGDDEGLAILALVEAKLVAAAGNGADGPGAPAE